MARDPELAVTFVAQTLLSTCMLHSFYVCLIDLANKGKSLVDCSICLKVFV